MDHRKSVLVLLVVFGGALLWRQMHKRRKAESAAPEMAKVTEPVIQSEDLGVKKPRLEAQMVADAAATAKAAITASAEQLDAGYLSVPGNGKIFSYVVAIETVCHWGDADLLKLDMATAGKGKHILLSVEPLHGYEGRYAPVTHTLVASDLVSGTSGQLLLPQVDHSVPSGLFICTDSDGSGHCAAKSAEALTDAMLAATQVTPITNPGKSRVPARPDRVYFFQSMILEPSGARIQLGTRPRPAGKAHLDAYLKSRVGRSEATKVATGTAELNQTITSIPVTFAAGAVRLVLDRQDRSHCDPDLQDQAHPPGLDSAMLPDSGYAQAVDVSKLNIPPPPTN